MVATLCLPSAPLALRRPGILTNANGSAARAGAGAGPGPVIKASPTFVRLSSHCINRRVNYAVLSESPASAVDEEEGLPKRNPEDLIVDPGEVVKNLNQSELSAEDSLRYLTEILTSKVYDVAIETPLQLAEQLLEKTKINFWMKREDKQEVFSFKLRGAYNMMSKLTQEQLDIGVITASAGNHAQGVALSAYDLKCIATIVMPTTAPQIKIDAVKRFGGDYVKVELQGNTFDEAQAYALQKASNDGLVYIPPFDAEDVLLGQGTIAVEIVKQMAANKNANIDAIFVPVGGGGIVAGILAYIKSIKPGVKVFGVEPASANSMAISIKEGQRIELNYTETIADGVAVRVIGESTFAVSKQLLDGVVLVSEANIAGAIKDVFNETRTILEPSGAVALAGAKAYCEYPANNVKPGANMVTIMSGANMDFEKIPLVVELAGVGQGNEALLSTSLPGDPHESLKKFFQILGPSINITEFRYSVDDPKKDSHIATYKISINSAEELNALIAELNAANLTTINVSGNLIVHDYLKNLSSRSGKIEDLLLAKFVLPEKPGALKGFLDEFSKHYNISLISYQYRGDINGRVLVGLQVPKNKVDEFHKRCQSRKLEYRVHSDNPGYKFLQGK